MHEVRIKSFPELHDALSRYRDDNAWIFRGQSIPEWQLIPKAGREPYIEFDDIVIFEAWKRRAVEFISGNPKDDWDWLAIAQHHGLATRLLDWTFNPLAAAFFAVYEQFDCDAVIYAYLRLYVVSTHKFNPSEIEGVGCFRPRGVAQRITRQSGMFTVHAPPTLSLENALRPDDKLEKIIIDQSYRKELIFELSHYGVNKLTLFPDLDGLSEFMNWHMANRLYWKGTKRLNDVE